jgi:hypothetical protein
MKRQPTFAPAAVIAAEVRPATGNMWQAKIRVETGSTERRDHGGFSG